MATRPKDAMVAPHARKKVASLRTGRNESQSPVHEYRRLPPTDNLGSSVTVHVTVPPTIRRTAARLCMEEHFPFDNEQDVFRWCLANGIDELMKRTKNRELTGEHRKLNSMMRVLRFEIEQSYYGKILDVHREGILGLAREGHWEKALAHAEGVWANTDAIGDPYWREIWREKAKEIKAKVSSLKKAHDARVAREEG